MKHPDKAKPEFYIGARVNWIVGNSKKDGEIVDIYKSNKASGLSVRTNRENDRVLVIQQKDGRVIMKLESDVEVAVSSN
jgi:hypothetical protein